MVHLCMIPHSNCFIERMFPIVNANKTYLGNSLDVSTVSTLLKIKSYYSENDILDVSKYHLTLKKHIYLKIYKYLFA